ncbi:permease-like cell division protein FtsX [Marinicellulosiphila megalodicopiae]|uniref:permease-like cell division protein FtsX n=1 Tax=Marinicellulosiphila megalodicopiae TaxID=2724896 RepID=UPI003BAE8C92
MAKKSSGASRRKISSKEKRSAWLFHHRQMMVGSIKQIMNKPLSSALTWLVIAISLSLPSLLFVALDNITDRTADLQKGGRITLFLHSYVSENEALDIVESLQARDEIKSAEFLSKELAWEQMQQQFVGQKISQLVNQNPLPSAIEVIPKQDDLESIERLQLVLENLGVVSEILVDMAWVERLNAWLLVIKQTVWVIATLLALTVLLVVGNTIRLNIEAHREEITVSKLVGATDAFVRRGFLYMGFWYGFLGAIGAWIVVFICSLLLQQPLKILEQNYGGMSFSVMQWDIGGTIYLLLGSIFCAMIGAWLAVWRHLRDINPA